ncbi:MAG: 6-phosphogluconolactonase [Gammaproteobacteria bacterium]|nr:6-phosphogluconolactonase [Gammaproteobacteria bacterium]MDH5630037.1 6-phosphogluconolactonase [Gammaproteobacteria bacterium]
MKKYIFDNREPLYQAVSDRISDELISFLKGNAEASLIVPGGSTPKPVFNLLSQKELNWEKIQIIPSDERWISSDHEASNFKLIEQSLQIDQAEKARILSLKNSAETPFDGQAEIENEIKRNAKPTVVTLIGMGEDGHFASLFPESPQLKDGLNSKILNCVAIDAGKSEVAGEYRHRMSLTLNRLLKTNLVIVLITGEKKMAVVDNAIQQNDPEKLPIAAVLNQSSVPVEIYWAK